MAGGGDARAHVLIQPQYQRNQETRAAADRKGRCGGDITRTTRAMLKRLDWLMALCVAWHQCLSRRLPSRPVDSAPSLAIPGIGSRHRGYPQKSALHLWVTHRKPKCMAEPRGSKVTPNQCCNTTGLHAHPVTWMQTQHKLRQRRIPTPHCNKLDQRDAPVTELHPHSSRLWVVLDWQSGQKLCYVGSDPRI